MQDLALSWRQIGGSVGGKVGGTVGGEFQVNGQAKKIEDTALRSLAESFSNFRPATSSNLFELLITDALSTIYRGGRPLRDRWAAGAKKEIKS